MSCSMARAHAALVHQPEQHARVRATAAGAHREPLHPREAHGARHAIARLQGAGAHPVAEVADDGLAGRRPCIEARQHRGQH
jgi:hypothetical protein